MKSVQTLKILLIEDSPSDVLLQEALEADPLSTFELTTVERLADGIGRLQEETFDILLADLGLPDSSGLFTFERMYLQAPDLPTAAAIRAVSRGRRSPSAPGCLPSSMYGMRSPRTVL